MGCGGPSGPAAPSIGTAKSSAKQHDKSKSDKSGDLGPVSPVSEGVAFDLAAEDAASDPAAADVRYFSLAFLQSNGISSENLDTVRKATSKLMNSLSWQPSLGMVTAIDPGNAVLKIRLSEFGWTKATWDTLVASHPDAGTGVPGLEVLKQRTGSQKPMIRAEWFVRNASSPPLYYQLGNAPENAAKLAARLGISFDGDISAGRVKRAGLVSLWCRLIIESLSITKLVTAFYGGVLNSDLKAEIAIYSLFHWGQAQPQTVMCWHRF